MRNSGYTLVEMLIVVIVIGILGAIGVPLVGKSRPQRAVRLAADQFVSAHALAKSTAVRYGRLAELHIDAAGSRFWVEVDTSSTAVVRKDTIGVVRRVGTTGLVVTSDRTVVCFDARGLPTQRNGCQAGNVTVTFGMGSNVRTVYVTALGKVLR